jgi:lipoprotein-anchoring transpeptidase ErfK/SrfK
MAHVVVRASIALVAAALTCCGGAGHELARPLSHQSRGEGPAPMIEPPRARVTALAPAKAHAIEAAAKPANPTPFDAWAEHIMDERAAQSGFEQRFPLHGIAFHLLAQVFSEPSDQGQVIGYLRRGTRLRASEGHPGRGCDRTWHELANGGFVCAGRGFSFGRTPQSFEPSPLPAALTDALPYHYAKNNARAVLQYWRVPTKDEERAATGLLATAPEALLRLAETNTSDATAASELKLPDYARMPMEPGFYVSVDRTEQDGERAFVRTVRGAYVSADALTDVKVSAAPGVVLDAATDLPLAIAPRAGAKVLARDGVSGALQPSAASLPRFAVLALADARVEQAGRSYRMTRGGDLVAESQFRVAERSARPALVPKAARWIHVNLEQQTLVAYEGARAVFATLVSSGKEGFETPRGLFRIFAKHVSATMDGLAGNDEAYSIEDVPWTMYFQGNYALHAAFWHDKFGNVRSHGCVNLAPADAHWLFRWATPVLPNGWHGVIADRNNAGTFVFID